MDKHIMQTMSYSSPRL